MNQLESILGDTKLAFVMKHLDAVLAHVKMVKLLPVCGDLIEIGVYRGGTLNEIAKRAPKGVQVIGYDTFSGLPSPSAFDAGVKMPHLQGDFADTSLEALKALLPSNVKLIQGIYPQSADLDIVEFAHLDVDFYDGTYASLLNLQLDMVVGGVVVVDDYGWHRTPGVKRAVEDFMKMQSDFDILEVAEFQIALKKVRNV